MDIIKKYAIAHKGLTNGKHHFDFEVNDKFFSAFDGSEIKAGHASISIEVDKSSTGLVLQVEILGSVTVECDRCLEDCILPVEFRAPLIVRYSDTIKEYDGDVMWISQSETEVSLSQYIYESIYLSLPYQKVHPTNEAGEPMCDPTMLARFKIVTPEEFEHIVEPEQTSNEDNPQWAKLKELKDKLNK